MKDWKLKFREKFAAQGVIKDTSGKVRNYLFTEDIENFITELLAEEVREGKQDTSKERKGHISIPYHENHGPWCRVQEETGKVKLENTKCNCCKRDNGDIYEDGMCYLCYSHLKQQLLIARKDEREKIKDLINNKRIDNPTDWGDKAVKEVLDDILVSLKD